LASVREVADTYIEQMAALDPVAATAWGVPGHDDRLPDLSPDGIAARADRQRQSRAALSRSPRQNESDRSAAEVMEERLGADLDRYEAGDHYQALRVLHSPQDSVRRCFDLMPFDTEEDWRMAATRLRAVPDALAGWRATLEEGRSRRVVSARRQVEACAGQCDVWGGRRAEGSSFFDALARRYPGGPSAVDLGQAARMAGQAFLDFGTWLRQSYLPEAATADAVGRERYLRAVRYFTGSELDLEDTYRYGWSELYRIEDRMSQVCEQIRPGGALPEVISHLESDPDRAIEGVETFQHWNQDLIDSTMASLEGVHFDIPEPIRRCEAMIAPPGGAAAMYYTGPSEDLTRPGRTWYPTLGKTRFPLWREVSICYHEGVPGHHLQVGQVRFLADRLNRFQRLAGFVSGHGEGWALYAERLMGELGYLEDPVYELGMLSAQAMRAVRVIVDIGMHLELPIPSDERYHPGERWTPELALPFVIERSCFPADFMASEVDRYLGLPGQAISYKVGERAWLDGREAARRRQGASFDLKAFHRFALNLGGMGLDQLSRELQRF
jgi:uncharacterized protein (DUF885 family)